MESHEEVDSLEDYGSAYSYEESDEGWKTLFDRIDPFLLTYIDKEIHYSADQEDVLYSIRSTDCFLQEETIEETLEILDQFPLDVLSNIVLLSDCAKTLYYLASTFKRFRKAINLPGVQGKCKALSFAQHYSLVLPSLQNVGIVTENIEQENKDFVDWYEGSFYTENSDELQKTYYDVDRMNFSRFNSDRPLMLGKEIESRYIKNIYTFVRDENVERYLSFFVEHGAYDAVLSLIREISYRDKRSATLIDIILSSPLFPSENTPPDIHSAFSRSDGGKELVFYLLTWVAQHILRREMSKEMEVIVERLRQLKVVFTVEDLLTLPERTNSCINEYYSSSESY